MSDSRFLIGTAYKNLIFDKTASQTPLSFEVARSIDRIQRGLRITPEEKRQIYHDRAVVLNASSDDLNMDELPIYVNHDLSTPPVGKIHQTVIDGSNIKIIAEVWEPSVIKQMDDGILKSLSVGYNFDTAESGWYIGEKRLREISLVRTPFFKGCDVIVTATGEPDNTIKLDNKKIVLYNDLLALDLSPKLASYFVQMSAPTAPVDAPEAASSVAPLTKEEFQHFLAVHKQSIKDRDDLKKQIEGLKKIEEENQRFKKLEEERLAKERKKTSEELDQMFLNMTGAEQLVSVGEKTGEEMETESLLQKEEYEALVKHVYNTDNEALVSAIKKLGQRSLQIRQSLEPREQPEPAKAAPPQQGRLADVYTQKPAVSERLQSMLRETNSAPVPSPRTGDPYKKAAPAYKKPVTFANEQSREVPVTASGEDYFTEAVQQIRDAIFKGPRLDVGARVIPATFPTIKH